MLGGFFHDLWSLLQKIMRKIECSIGCLWIFPQLVDFLARNLKITWTDKDLKGKENINKRDREKRLEERENHLSKGENVGKDKRKAFTEKNFFFFSIFVCCFGYRLEFFISLCRNNFLLED